VEKLKNQRVFFFFLLLVFERLNARTSSLQIWDMAKETKRYWKETQKKNLFGW
jgi:hypothetical protein